MPGVDCIQRSLRKFPAQREMAEQGELERLPGAPRASAEASADPAQSEEGAYAELQLSDAARFYPSDAALARWRSQADAGRAVIAYE